MDDNPKCKHNRYTSVSKMNVVKMSELDSWQLIMKVTVFCANCHKPFTFRAHHGFSTMEPTISNDSNELRIPIDYPGEELGEVDTPPPGGVMH